MTYYITEFHRFNHNEIRQITNISQNISVQICGKNCPLYLGDLVTCTGDHEMDFNKTDSWSGSQLTPLPTPPPPTHYKISGKIQFKKGQNYQ